MCNYGFASVLLSLPQKSKTINVNVEGKEQGRDMQTPIDDSSILLRYREARKLPPSPCWSPSQGIPRKGQAPGRVIPWIAPGLLHVQVGLWCAFRQASPRPRPVIFTIKLPTEPSRALFPSIHGGGHTTNAVGVISQDYKPLRCTTMVRASTQC